MTEQCIWPYFSRVVKKLYNFLSPVKLLSGKNQCYSSLSTLSKPRDYSKPRIKCCGENQGFFPFWVCEANNTRSVGLCQTSTPYTSFLSCVEFSVLQIKISQYVTEAKISVPQCVLLQLLVSPCAANSNLEGETINHFVLVQKAEVFPFFATDHFVKNIGQDKWFLSAIVWHFTAQLARRVRSVWRQWRLERPMKPCALPAVVTHGFTGPV